MLIQFIMSGPIGFLSAVTIVGGFGLVIMHGFYMIFEKICGYFFD